MKEESKYDKVGYWLKWIKSAKKAAKRHWQDAKSAYREYRFEFDIPDDGSKKFSRGFAIYNTACQTLEPAYYGRTPRVIAKRKHGIEDEMALTMSLIAERLGQHLVDNGHFDEGMIAARDDFIQAAKATTQVIEKGQKNRVSLTLMEGGGYYDDATDAPYQGEPLQDEEGVYYEQVDDATHEVILAPCPFDEVLHTPEAKCNSEIKDMAYKFCMSKDEAIQTFGDRPLPFKSAKAALDEEDGEYKDEKDSKESEWVLEGWQIHCKETKRVYWVAEGHPEFLKEPESDTLQLAGFFPSPPFKIINRARKSLYPTPPYVFLEGIVNQLHQLYERQFKLISSIRRRALVSNASPELIKALNSLDDQEYYAISNLQDMLEKAQGVDKLIFYVPVQELVASINETLQVRQDFENTFYQFFGVPDILRGISDPAETAEAQGIKADAAHDRFKYNKKQMVDLARESAELMLDLALKVFSDRKIAGICGYEYLERGTPAMPPDEQNPQGTPGIPGHYERFTEALIRLRNDTERLVTIDFETDSTSFRDEARELSRQQMIAQTLQNSLGAISSMQDPNMVRITLRATMAVLEAMGGSSQVEDQLKKIGADLEKMADAPPPPPPPDYEGMKIQIAQQKVQTDAMKAQADAQVKQADIQTKMQEMMLEERDREFNRMLESAKMQTEQIIQNFQQIIDAQRLKLEQALVQIEQFKSEVQARETIMEEKRLALETMLEARNGSQPQEPREPTIVQVPAPTMPPLNITLDMPKPGKRTGTIVRPDGSITKIEVEPPAI